MMRKKNDHRIDELLGQFAESRQLKRGMKKMNLRKFWQERMGELINRYTTDIYIAKDTLIVKIESSPLRQELSYEVPKILELLREEFGKDYITNVKFQ